MNLSIWLLSIAGIFYAAAFLFYLLSFTDAWQGDKPAFVFMCLGFLTATFYLAEEAVGQGFFLPVTNLSQALVFFAWSLAFVYLVLLVKAQTESFSLILTPILLLLIGGGLVSKSLGVHPAPPRPVFLNPYFILHIATAFFAYASFTLSFAAGILYLIQHHELKAKRAGTFYHKLTSLEELEKLIYQPLFWGTPLLAAAGAIGFVWSKSVFGQYWFFDPKTIATGITAVLYLAILYLRYVPSLRGKHGAILSLVAFAFVVFSFVETRLLQGSHNF